MTSSMITTLPSYLEGRSKVNFNCQDLPALINRRSGSTTLRWSGGRGPKACHLGADRTGMDGYGHGKVGSHSTKDMDNGATVLICTSTYLHMYPGCTPVWGDLTIFNLKNILHLRQHFLGGVQCLGETSSIPSHPSPCGGNAQSGKVHRGCGSFWGWEEKPINFRFWFVFNGYRIRGGMYT